MITKFKNILLLLWLPIITSIVAPAITNNLIISIVILISISFSYIFLISWLQEMNIRKTYEKQFIRTSDDKTYDIILNLLKKSHNDIIDDKHRYLYLGYFPFIDKDGNYYGKYIRKGKNVSGRPSNYIYFATISDSNVSFDELNTVAYDIKNKNELKIEKMKDDLFRKFIKIYFKKPVENNQEFEISIKFCWPRCMKKTGDVDAINIEQFKRGVDKIEWQMIFDWELNTYLLFEDSGDGEEIITQQPIKYKENDQYFYHWELDNPKAKAYIFRYL